MEFMFVCKGIQNEKSVLSDELVSNIKIVHRAHENNRVEKQNGQCIFYFHIYIHIYIANRRNKFSATSEYYE